MTIKEEALKQLTQATRTLADYEKKYLSTETPSEDKPFIKERIEFWSGSIDLLRKEVFELQSQVQHRPSANGETTTPAVQ